MRSTLTIKNYRCFVQPTTVEIAKGFTAFVGINNAGKSAIMRFLIELRVLFQKCQSGDNFIHAVVTDAYQGGLHLLHVQDPEEVFSNLNSEDLTF